MSKLRFSVCFCSGEEPEYPADELNAHRCVCVNKAFSPLYLNFGFDSSPHIDRRTFEISD